MPPNRFDGCSISNFDEAILKEAVIKFDVDFEHKILHGLVKLIFVVIKEPVHFIVLDMESQEIVSVHDVLTGDSLKFSSPEPDSLKIEIPPHTDMGSIINLVIKYQTNPGASGLFWLDPQLFDDETNPFLFSHSMKTHCRSIFPCQDALAVKFTFYAEVLVNKDLGVVMSAVLAGVEDISDEKHKYKFTQNLPMSSCRFALVVGALDCCKVGPRSTLWGPKNQMNTGAYELAELENTLILGEQLCGDYFWQTADIVLMPSVYPFTAVAHPNCLYMPSASMDSDRDYTLARVVTQAWLGCLVAPCSWEHLWISEGFTTYIARKIISRVHGDPVFHLLTNIGLDDLRNEVRQLMMSGSQGKYLTKLVSDAQVCRPHEGLSILLSEKGHIFLTYLEQLVGGPAQFEPFIRTFVNSYKFKSLDSNDFMACFTKYFSTDSKVQVINWNQWFFSIGLPWTLPAVDTSLIEEPVRLAQEWRRWDLSIPSPLHLSDLSTLLPLQVAMFLSHLYNACPTFPVTKLRNMQQLYSLNQIKNPEIKLKWLLLCIQAKCPEQLPECLKFLEEVHQHIFVQPLLKKLRNWEEFKQEILKHYHEHKKKMLLVTQQLYEAELHIPHCSP